MMIGIDRGLSLEEKVKVWDRLQNENTSHRKQNVNIGQSHTS